MPGDVVARTGQVDPGVLGLERSEVRRLALVLRITGIACGDTLEDSGQQSSDRLRELRRQLLPRVFVVERDADLAEDVPRVELGVHVVEREADLLLAVAHRPRNGARPPVAREKRGMAVHDAVARDGERIRRDLPREADAQGDVRLEQAEQRRHSVARPKA